MISSRSSQSLTSGPAEKPHRRSFLRVSLLSSGAFLAGFEKLTAFAKFRDSSRPDSLEGGKLLELLEFAGESRAPLNSVLGAGLDARLYTDLSAFTRDRSVTPTKDFYVRTGASELLASDKPWSIQVRGLVQQPMDLSLDELKRSAKPMGLHLMECSGNARSTRFGLISVADWAGTPISAILEMKAGPKTDHVIISGFDEYPKSSLTSVPGAAWMFTVEQLKAAKAFLATEMNGQALMKDHGAPVRLVVPGWYGCTCIKWVNALTFTDESAPATTQMQEFATRTHQQGVPKLAKDYRPATIDQAAMPIRVEKWLVRGKIKYRVVGILWGGSRVIKILEIRFNPEEDYVRVDDFSQTTNDPWSFWSHTWAPKTVGSYMIRLRVTDPVVETKRLDSGYYVRSVEVKEI
jgi:DMSO/TMAO reductase YedYZ molybdopterin-dependent catalytic subunit